MSEAAKSLGNARGAWDVCKRCIGRRPRSCVAALSRRENGGNCDIKNLSRGCKVYFPVFVEGANLSMGDMHFSQVRCSCVVQTTSGMDFFLRSY